MSSKKQITIDPSGLSGGAAHNVTMKRQRKMKPPVALLRPSTVKKNLLEKIKDYKRRNEETAAPDQPQPKMTDTDLANQFKTSSNYLEQLMHRKKEGRKAKPNPVMQQPATQPMPMPIMHQPMPMPIMHQPVPMPIMHQPIMQSMQSSDHEISLELPPELQINPIPIFQEPLPLYMPAMNAFTPAPVSAPVSVPVSVPVPVTQIKNDVPYGCLRNGNKPTYRTYHRKIQPPPVNQHNHTMKKPIATDINAPFVAPLATELDAEETAIIQERQRKLREVQERASASATAAASASATATASASASSEMTPPQPEHTKIRIKQTITKKYRLGRSPGGNVVGVLIKNNDTRRQVQEECGLLKREPIIDVRKYLHDHGMLKVGSDAPPDVLRNMYESAKLTGDVNNVNKTVILHNFMANATA